MTKSTPSRYLVIYADDDPDDLQFLEEAFSHKLVNIELVTFSNGQQVMDYLNQLSVFAPNPSLIILDINMPLMNGKETLREIRRNERFRDLPVVLFTTSALEQDKHFARRHGADFIVKPLNHSQMHRMIEDFIDRCEDEIKKNIKKTIR